MSEPNQGTKKKEIKGQKKDKIYLFFKKSRHKKNEK